MDIRASMSRQSISMSPLKRPTIESQKRKSSAVSLGASKFQFQNTLNSALKE